MESTGDRVGSDMPDGSLQLIGGPEIGAADRPSHSSLGWGLAPAANGWASGRETAQEHAHRSQVAAIFFIRSRR